MLTRTRLLTLAVILAFAGFLLYSTLAAQRAECAVCTTYDGKRSCASASASSIAEAARSAQATACGTLTHGMNDQIACSRRPPETKECKVK